jgi:hypothetical protein
MMKYSLPLAGFVSLILCSVLPFHSAYAVDLKAIGQNLDNDTVPMLDRYVYFDEETVSKNVPIDLPVLSKQDIQTWLQQYVADALTLDGRNYDQKTLVNQKYFTTEGYSQYIKSLNVASLPTLLKQQYYHVSAVIPLSPEITQEGVRDTTPAVDRIRAENANLPVPKNFIYVWQVTVPTILTYSVSGKDVRYNVDLEIELIRIPVREDGEKIAINAWRFGKSSVAKDPTQKATEEEAVSDYEAEKQARERIRNSGNLFNFSTTE